MSNYNSSIKGKICISKPGETKYIYPEELNTYIELGYVQGNINNIQKSQNKKWYNNGKENLLIKDGDIIPDGFIPGMYQKRPNGYSKFNYVWYTNGVEEKRLSIQKGDIIPEGWYKGHSIQYKEKMSKKLKEKGNFHLDTKLYTDEYKELYHDKDKLYKFVKNNNTLTLEQLAERFSCSIGSVYSLLNTYDLQKEFTWYNNQYSGISKLEKEIKDFIKSIIADKVIINTRLILNGQELDIYIPSKKLAIEINGNYWHNSNNKTRNYHLNKTIQCENLGIRLIHIFEYEWLLKQEICKSIISSALGIYEQKIYARNCSIQEVDSKVAKQFLNNNHIQGAINSTYRLGLFYNNELVQLICLGKSRFKANEYELLRMCTKLNTQIIGGFSKLMKYQPYKNIISYIDRSKFTGNSYFNNNWSFINYTQPSYLYTNGKVIISRIKAQKHKLEKLLGKDNFNSLLSEKENMYNNGFHQLFDCGNIKVQYMK